MEDNLFQYLIKEDFRLLHVVTTGAYYPPVVTTRAHICHEYHEFYLSRGEMSAFFTVPNVCGEKSVRSKYVWRKNDRSGYNMEDFDYRVRSILFDNRDIVHCVCVCVFLPVISMHNENISDEKKWICSL